MGNEGLGLRYEMTALRTDGVSKLLGPCNNCCSSIEASMALVRACSISVASASEGRSRVGPSTAKEG